MEIIIEIGTDGTATVEGKDIIGSDCTKLTAALEAALGEVTKRDLKPSYHQTGVVRRSTKR
jgi:hypothetical protein